ncbi:MAG: hypothetical protein WC623_22275 [Pedobacter sp.]|uniref:hypothetical protein n=1 Tax=Pedobacter sp. TaxID=1411316 RepID=UPI003562D3CE
MKKIEIHNCIECPNKKNTSNIQGAFCDKAKKFLGKELTIIPKWCPLPDDGVFEEYCGACLKIKPNCIDDPHSNLGNPSFICLDCLR